MNDTTGTTPNRASKVTLSCHPEEMEVHGWTAGAQYDVRHLQVDGDDDFKDHKDQNIYVLSVLRSRYV